MVPFLLYKNWCECSKCSLPFYTSLYLSWLWPFLFHFGLISCTSKHQCNCIKFQFQALVGGFASWLLRLETSLWTIEAPILKSASLLCWLCAPHVTKKTYVTLLCCHLAVWRNFFQTSLYLNLIRSNKMDFLSLFMKLLLCYLLEFVWFLLLHLL